MTVFLDRINRIDRISFADVFLGMFSQRRGDAEWMTETEETR